MGVKRVLVAVVAMVTLFSLQPLAAQERGEWSGGAKFNVYSRWDGTMGVGVYARYGLLNHMRLEPSFVFLCREGMSLDVSVDAQFPFNVEDKLELYPMAGLSLNDPGKFGLGINVGGGASYAITKWLSFDTGIKWIIQTQGIKNPILFSFGGGFKF